MSVRPTCKSFTLIAMLVVVALLLPANSSSSADLPPVAPIESTLATGSPATAIHPPRRPPGGPWPRYCGPTARWT